MSIENGKEALGIRRIAIFDDHVEDQTAATSGQSELVAVENIAAALADDVGMRFDQADQLLRRRRQVDRPAWFRPGKDLAGWHGMR